MSEKIEIINSHKASIINGDSYIFITDTHADQNQGHSDALIEKIIADTRIDTIVHGGDFIRGQSTISEYWKVFANEISKYANLTNNFYPVLGNHDNNKYGTDKVDYVTASNTLLHDVYRNSLCYPASYKGDMTYGNYYFDNKAQKIRYFVLGSMKETQLNKRLLNWLNSSLMSTEDGYSIVVFLHGLYNTTQYDMSVDANILCGLLDAVNNKTTYVSTTNDKNINADFSNKNLKVILIMCGHTHTDYNTQTESGIPIVVTTCDTYLDEKKTANTVGTYQEQAFDVVQIDMDNKKIYCTRIGFGEDREFGY